MQKWEYVQIRVNYLSQTKVDRIFSNGIPFPIPGKVVEMGDFLNSLGSNGWELVNSVRWDSQTEVYYLKRPIK